MKRTLLRASHFCTSSPSNFQECELSIISPLQGNKQLLLCRKKNYILTERGTSVHNLEHDLTEKGDESLTLHSGGFSDILLVEGELRPT